MLVCKFYFAIFFFDLLWPTGTEISIVNSLTKTFGLSIVITVVLYATLKNENKENS
jgi:hypothetical protein